jgi:HAMP domain-containing protein
VFFLIVTLEKLVIRASRSLSRTVTSVEAGGAQTRVAMP